MISPIIPRDKEELKPVNTIGDERFKYLIREIYNTMLTYCTLRKKSLTKTNTMRFGNVSFWFEYDDKGSNAQLVFSQPVSQWDEASIVADIDQYFYDLHYSNAITN